MQPSIAQPSCPCSNSGGSPAASPTAPAITFIYNDTCAPAGVAAATSPIGAVYFTAVVEFSSAVLASSFTASNATVAAAAPFTPGSGGACGCQQQPRRGYAPGGALAQQLREAACDATLGMLQQCWAALHTAKRSRKECETDRPFLDCCRRWRHHGHQPDGLHHLCGARLPPSKPEQPDHPHPQHQCGRRFLRGSYPSWPAGRCGGSQVRLTEDDASMQRCRTCCMPVSACSCMLLRPVQVHLCLTVAPCCCRPRGMIYGSGSFAFTNGSAISIDPSVAVFTVAFSEPVTGITTTAFVVNGPPSATLAVAPFGAEAYRLRVNTPSGYCGPVTITLIGPFKDSAGQGSCDQPTITYLKSCGASAGMAEVTATQYISPFVSCS